MAISFGTKQINNPTPASINKAVRVFTIAAGVFLGWMATTNLMGPNTKDILTQVLALMVSLVNGLAPLFGVELPSSTVPSGSVTAVEATKV